MSHLSPQARMTQELVEQEFSDSVEQFMGILNFLRSDKGRRLNHKALEEGLAEKGQELLRHLFQAGMDLRVND